MTPEQAVAEARRRAAQGRAGSAYPDLPAASRGGAPVRSELRELLVRWALVEPDRAQVYSTRRLGAPITAAKRLLIRLLRQYLDQVTAQQSRFNAHAAAQLLALEDRVGVLERELLELRAAAAAAPPDQRR